MTDNSQALKHGSIISNVATKKSALVLMVTLLAGCAVGPDYQQPVMETPSTFARKLEVNHQRADAAMYIADAPIVQFWTIFDDTVLNGLVAQALATNHDIRIAAANLKAARAIRGGAQSDLFPSVTANAAREKSRRSADETVSGVAEDSTLNIGALDAYWELDLFGRVRRNIEANRASEQAIGEDLRAAKVSIAAEVARNYMELRGAQEQHAVAQNNAENQRQTLRIVDARLDAGRGTEFDSARASALLNTTLSQVPVLQAEIDIRIHRLSVLMGQQPIVLTELLRPVEVLPALPRLVQIGKPENLLRRRPDIRAAERRLAAATANIGVAQADWFPRVSFSGEIGFAANSRDRIGDADTATYRYGPGISWSALDFGHVRARVLESKAEAEGSLAIYEQTVLRALEETENALALYSSTRMQLDYLQASVTANARAAELAHLRFENGGADFLEVLDVERERLDTDATFTRARTAAATNLIAVYKALGGGWETVADSVALQE